MAHCWPSRHRDRGFVRPDRLGLGVGAARRRPPGAAHRAPGAGERRRAVLESRQRRVRSRRAGRASTPSSTCAASTSAATPWSGAFKQSLRDSRIAPTEVLSHAVADAGVRNPDQRQRGRLLRRHQGPRRRRNRPAGNGFPGPAVRGLGGGHAAGPGRPGTRVVLARTGLVLSPGRRRAGPDAAVVLGWASAPGWATAGSTCRGSASRTRCGRCCSRSSHDDLSGPVNLTGPAPVTNAEFTAAFGPRGEPADPAAGARFRRARRARRVRRRGPARAGSARSRPRWSAPDSSSTTTPSARRSATPPHGATTTRPDVRVGERDE